MNLPNARQALEAIKEDSANIRSRIVRHVVPLLGGPEVKKRNQEPGLLFLESISPQQIVDLDPLLLDQRLKGLEEKGVITNDTVRNVKSSFQKFRAFLLVRRWAAAIELSEDEPIVGFRRKYPEKNLRQAYKAPYSLGACVGDYRNEYLKQQIEEFSEFLLLIKKQSGAEGVESEIRLLRLILGWLTKYNTPEPRAVRNPDKIIDRVRSEKIPMSELRLENLVPFVKLNLKENYSKRQERQEAEDDAYEEATRIAKEMIIEIEKFLNFFSPVAKSRTKITNTYLNVAKFLYRDERKIDSKLGYDEKYRGIPAVEEIRKLTKKYVEEEKNSQPAIPKSQKTIPWIDEDNNESIPDVYDVLLHLKSKADAKKNSPIRVTYKSGNTAVIRRDREPTAIARSYYKFLCFAFFCVIPPARQQVLRNLVIGESFVWGQIIGEEVIDASQMSDPSRAKWVIGLRGGKTAKTYGFHPYYLPNHKFPDGTFLYDYINKWIYEHRKILEPKTNHLFFGPFNKMPLTKGAVYEIVRAATEGYTGMSIGPHQLRRLFNSYIENGHVNPQLKTNMRNRQMTQSDKVAKEVYTTFDANKIDAPMNQFFQDIISKKGKTHLTIPDLPPRGVNAADLWAAMTPQQKAEFLKDKSV